MIDICVTLVLAFHLICVNLAAGGLVVCVALEVRARTASPTGIIAKRLAHASLFSLVVGILLGTLLLGMVWDNEYPSALRRMAPKLTTGGWELLFSIVLMVVHSCMPAAVAGMTWKRCLARASVPFLAGTNLLYHFPLLFIILAREAVRPTAEFPVVTSSAFRSLMMRGDVLAQAVHFWIATFAVTGIYLTLLAPKGESESAGANQTTHPGSGSAPHRPAASGVSRAGARLALVATLLQIPAGIWLVSRQSPLANHAMLGGDWLITGLLAGAIGLTLWLLHCLAALATGDESPAMKRLAAMLLVVIVLLMTGVLRQARSTRVGVAVLARPASAVLVPFDN